MKFKFWGEKSILLKSENVKIYIGSVDYIDIKDQLISNNVFQLGFLGRSRRVKCEKSTKNMIY